MARLIDAKTTRFWKLSNNPEGLKRFADVGRMDEIREFCEWHDPRGYYDGASDEALIGIVSDISRDN